MDMDTALLILKEMHKLYSTCYEAKSFIENQPSTTTHNRKNLPSAASKRLIEHNIMSSHRVMVTPTKIFCLGPELESSNYIVKNFADYASDFMRVTFVDEDWGRLSVGAVSTSIMKGIFAKPYRTDIYRRIVSVLRDGIVIGDKKFEFLAFSASQLRSNSVWMFASNDHVNPRDVELIPDIEAVSNGVKHCFSDGIGKISTAFAREVVRKLGLSHIPSAFQIRYGGYKGVIAVDRHSFRKLSLRSSMLKFESSNCMPIITKWSESQPCYLNSEIITLFSTLGIKDSVFLAMQDQQLQLLGTMLTNAKAALNVLGSTGGGDMNSFMARMDRIFVPKGHILVGCLDESGTLEYGQVFIRLTLNTAELEGGDQPFFHRVDETTSILKGKVVMTKNPCLHPGNVRVLEVVFDVKLLEDNMVDCLIFPQKGERPHPNECSGGDLDGDLYFISWDVDLIPPQTVNPMDYTGRWPPGEVTLEEIQTFFADYMISDTLGAISNAHLVHADCEPEKALSPKCLELANLHSMAVDFAKTGAPRLRCQGKLYRATIQFIKQMKPDPVFPDEIPADAFDPDLIVDGYDYYDAESEVEILTGNLHRKSGYLQHDNRRYGEVRERILVSVKSLMKEVKGWFRSSCGSEGEEQQKLASEWYYVTYHRSYSSGSRNCLGFPWSVGDILMDIKEAKSKMLLEYSAE
ncbi:hypothetical protein SASPL_138545 [Salvia splendens]|uniref:RNA-dependent RNA polymerase n=1 Tax=Salvia splendens TaxID=180675 RepID=A0A8X8ZE88_SALSN|nr:hypothetical protein SASPL_138545 [Salvia splendens]